MNVMDRLFSRKPRTVDSIGASLDTARRTLTEAQARVAAAADLRAAAIASGDRSAALEAASDRSAAEVDSEIAAAEIAGLEAGLAEAVRAAEAAAHAATVAAFDKRRGALAVRFESDWKRAAAVLADVLSEAATLVRDAREAKVEVERLPEIGRHAACVNSMEAVSKWAGDALSDFPKVPESPREAEFREYQAERDRKRNEAEKNSKVNRQAQLDKESAVLFAEREKDKWRERNPVYGGWRDVMDAAR